MGPLVSTVRPVASVAPVSKSQAEPGRANGDHATDEVTKSEVRGLVDFVSLRHKEGVLFTETQQMMGIHKYFSEELLNSTSKVYIEMTKTERVYKRRISYLRPIATHGLRKADLKHGSVLHTPVLEAALLIQLVPVSVD